MFSLKTCWNLAFFFRGVPTSAVRLYLFSLSTLKPFGFKPSSSSYHKKKQSPLDGSCGCRQRTNQLRSWPAA